MNKEDIKIYIHISYIYTLKRNICKIYFILIFLFNESNLAIIF